MTSIKILLLAFALQTFSLGAAPPFTLSTHLVQEGVPSKMPRWRCTMPPWGAPATTANNEGLWTLKTSTTTMVMRKGVDFVPAVAGLAAGVRIAKFISFWVSNQQTLALVQLSGTRITAANDQALLLYQVGSPVDGQVLMLMREGDTAPGCNGATIGVISRVEVESYWGQYMVLATLVGAPAGTELALFRGFSTKAVAAAEQTLRLPVPILRKGTLYNNQPGKIKSIALPLTNLTAAGAGTTGLGRAFQEGSGASSSSAIAIAVDFDNGVHQIMKGIP